ncbi:restriction endonuclease subunit S [Proteus columbae]|uniref:restriction endonuclease subunit S n=1 Tax=Proteus columbae TaxID=1987580 RepID=UPI002888FA23|nr:restriction endonuclease subunit S [Proteus columbae]
MSAGKLPEGWVESQLSEICSKPQYGYTTKSSASGEIKYLRTTDITKGAVNWSNVPHCLDIPDDVSKYQLHDRDIVISRAGSIGFSSLLKNPPSNAVFASYLIRFKPSDFFSESYLKRFLESGNYWNQLSSMSAGNAVQNVNAQKLSTLIVPIPPLVEQKIIAEKLDTLLAQVDSTKARLEQIPQILKRFRQAVLTAAISGKLTEDYRENQVITSWENTTLGTLIIDSCNGLAKRSGTDGEDITILRLADFKNAQRIRGNERKITLDSKEINKYSLKKSDILVIRVNGSADLAGRFIEYKQNDDIEGFCDHFIRLRLNSEKISSRFLTFIANEGEGRFYLRNSLSTSAGQNTINQTSIKGLALSLPTLPEQQEIVRRVEQLFAYADTIEKQVNNALARVNNLTQSILAKAFRGELTAQWRAENPDLISGENSAAALLEKIKAERAASSSKKVSRKKK